MFFSSCFFFFSRREFGLERFVPSSLIEGMKRKELRRLMAHFLKLNSQMTGSSTKMLTQLQVPFLLIMFWDYQILSETWGCLSNKVI